MLRDPFPAPHFPRLHTLDEWSRRRASILRRLRRLLGALPPRPRAPVATRVGRTETRHYVRDELLLDTGFGAAVPASFVRPRTPGPWPAVLWHHSHFGDYSIGREELFHPWPIRATPATVLARRGFAVLAIDAFAFGGRQGSVPGDPGQTGREEELSLAKYFLWRGTSLWAMMVRDDRVALDWLAARPEVDGRRIGAVGMSMGATRSWWLAALDDRVAATVAVACLTRYQDLIRAGQLSRHSFYYYVPGVLRHFDTEAIVSLAAPRPFLALTGARDPASPAAGVKAISRFARRVWRLYGRSTAFSSVLLPQVAHEWTRPMWDAAVEWLDRHLMPRQ